MYNLENSTESLLDAVIFDLAFDAVVGLRFTKNCSLFRLIGSKRDCDAEHKRVATNESYCSLPMSNSLPAKSASSPVTIVRL